MLEKGANLTLISKAIGHSNLGVTTQYLDIDVDEVADNLSDFPPAVSMQEFFMFISICNKNLKCNKADS